MAPRTHTPPLETRPVTVDDPNLAPATNERLTAELREVVGAEAVDVPSGRPRPSRGEHSDDAATLALGTNNWLMTTIAGFAALVVVGVAVTAITSSWWFMGLAFAIDVVGVIVVATTVVRTTRITERPDAALVAEMEREGVANPELRFTELVEEFAPAESADGGDRQTAVEDNHPQAAQEQKRAVTPTGGPSKAVGPGDNS